MNNRQFYSALEKFISPFRLMFRGDVPGCYCGEINFQPVCYDILVSFEVLLFYGGCDNLYLDYFAVGMVTPN